MTAIIFGMVRGILIVGAGGGAVLAAIACGSFAGSDSNAADAAADSPSGLTLACPNGLSAVLGTAYNPTPPDAGGACSIEKADRVDDQTASLDGDGRLGFPIDDRDINGCVGVVFTPAVELQLVVTRIKAIPGACQTPCADIEGGCNGQVYAFVFAGPTKEVGSMKRLGADPVNGGDSFADHTYAPPSGVTAIGAAVVCRDHKSGAAPDVGVDAIYGCR